MTHFSDQDTQAKDSMLQVIDLVRMSHITYHLMWPA